MRNMSVRARTLIPLALVLAATIVALYFVLARAVGGGFALVERDVGDRNVQRLREAFDADVESLCQKANDWASWDDAYAFAIDHNAPFVSANLASTAFDGMLLDFILLLDAKGNRLAVQGYDPGRETLASVPTALLDTHFAPGSPLSRHRTEDGRHAGLILTDGLPPAVFCSKPILTSAGKGPIRGSVVFGRFLRERERKRLEQVTRLRVAWLAEQAPSAGFDARSVLPELNAPEARVVRAESETTLFGYTRFVDVQGRHSLVARISMPRDIRRQATATLRYVVVALCALGLVALLAVVVVVERTVLRRIVSLSEGVASIASRCDYTARVPSDGADEIGKLSEQINGFLAAVEQVLYASADADSKYSALIGQSSVALAIVTIAPSDEAEAPGPGAVRIEECSSSFALLLGWHASPVGKTLAEAPGLGAEDVGKLGKVLDRARNSESIATVGVRLVRARTQTVAEVMALPSGKLLIHLAAEGSAPTSALQGEDSSHG